MGDVTGNCDCGHGVYDHDTFSPCGCQLCDCPQWHRPNPTWVYVYVAAIIVACVVAGVIAWVTSPWTD